MKLKTKYILFIVILHLVFLGLSYLILEKNKVIFIVSEVLVIISVVISIGLYRQLVEPLNYLREGISAINDRDFNVKFLPTGKQETDELIDVYNEMMDALREERTKQEAQHFFLEKLIHTSPTGIVILDYDNHVKQINPKAEEILGVNPELLLAQFEPLQVGESKTIRIGSLNTYKVQKSHFIDRGFPRMFVMIEEVTAEIFEAEKNAYGKVIRMMAHEVNNTIGPVNSIINMALDANDIWASADKSSLKNAMHVAVARNQNLNLFMRNFADLVKLTPVNKLQVDLVALIYSVSDFMHIKAKENGASFEFDLPNTPFYISADSQQMEQALINIVKNSVEAIEKEGIVRFALNTKLKKLTISDNGRGISEDLSEQLFSPFFSTKKDGQGIGLTLVREILLNHGFVFSLKTLLPGQTDFVIQLR
ncbi:PAS domain-containing sensor histidine kinase [Pedobacter foliorum]|uniref:sensor histidine kinase n=1 Tax=Pedobacter foliorum TaxID=2739058 RepID=UPI001565C5AF|nr:ATP-binding protein [Pedobacter foliorum]NRF37089.1 PAS domain-containing protein [Pedobacter foliorum]